MTSLRTVYAMHSFYVLNGRCSAYPDISFKKWRRTLVLVLTVWKKNYSDISQAKKKYPEVMLRKMKETYYYPSLCGNLSYFLNYLFSYCY